MMKIEEGLLILLSISMMGLHMIKPKLSRLYRYSTSYERLKMQRSARGKKDSKSNINLPPCRYCRKVAVVGLMKRTVVDVCICCRVKRSFRKMGFRI